MLVFDSSYSSVLMAAVWETGRYYERYNGSYGYLIFCPKAGGQFEVTCHHDRQGQRYWYEVRPSKIESAIDCVQRFWRNYIHWPTADGFYTLDDAGRHEFKSGRFLSHLSSDPTSYSLQSHFRRCF